MKLAKVDLAEIKSVLAHHQLRKAVAPWGIPAEVMRMLLLPNYRLAMVRSGIGYVEEKLYTPEVHRIVRQILMSIRASRSLPVTWLKTSLFEIES